MSIQSEISRINGAKTILKNFLQGQGVNVQNQRIDDLVSYLLNNLAIQSKTYTGIYTTGTSQGLATMYWARMTCTDYQTPWTVRFRVQMTIPNQNNYVGDFDLTWKGVGDSYSYYFVVNHKSTSYRTTYYAVMYTPKNGYTNDAAKGYLFGTDFRNSNNYNSSSYPRTIKVDLLEATNCSVTLFNAMSTETAMSISSTYYASRRMPDVAWNGLNETGDASNVDRNQLNSPIKAASAIAANNIIVNNGSGYFHLKTGQTFDLQYPILFAGSSLSANSTGSSNYIAMANAVGNTQSISLVLQKAVYIKGSLNGSKFTPISTAPLTQTEPTSADGYTYIRVGYPYSATQLYLTVEKPLFVFTGGSFREYTGKLTFTNVSVPASSFVPNSTYADYAYRASVPLVGVTNNHIPMVVFSMNDANSGRFGPVAESYNGGIYIYSAAAITSAITIPTIVAMSS